MRSFNEAAALHRGKQQHGSAGDALDRASMRPRLFTAENPVAAQVFQHHRAASMRPRLFTAENVFEIEELMNLGELQ